MGSNSPPTTSDVPEQPPAWLRGFLHETLSSLVPALLSSVSRPDDERIRILEARLDSQSQISKLDESLLRQLTNMQMFDGSGSRTWEDFEQEFRNKASQIQSLPRADWVRYMHSRICDRALEYAKSKELVDSQNQLTTTDFEAYCAKMAEAMFGDTLSKTGKIQALASMTQTGKLSNVMDFLRAKEKLLNQIPLEDMAGYVRAALAMSGMEPSIVTAISPNPTSPDGLFHSYADVRKQVVAVIGINNQLWNAAAQAKHTASQSIDSQPSHWKKHHSNRFDKHAGQQAGQQSGQHSGQKRQHGGYNNSNHSNTPAHSNKPAQTFKSPASATPASVPASASAPAAAAPASAPSGSTPNPFANAICEDCNRKGHANKRYYKCKYYVAPPTAPSKH